MTATGPEQAINNGPKNPATETLRQEVVRESREQIVEQLKQVAAKAADVKASIELQLQQGKPADLSGDQNNVDSPKGKATSVKQAVQKILIAAKMPEKAPTPVNKPPEVVSFASTVIKRLSDHIDPETDVSDQGAPYLHRILSKTINGELSTVADLVTEFENAQVLRAASAGLYEKVQQAFYDIAKDKGVGDEEAKLKFRLDEYKETPEQRARGGRGTFEGNWAELYSSYFSKEDQPFVQALYSSDGFLRYIDGMKGKLANGRDVNSVEVRKDVSQAIERQIVDLFGKLYTRLDHEKPSEFFHEIEQQDIMRGILPIRNDLKRRMTQLAFDLEKGEHEGIPDPGLFKSIEIKADVVDMKVEGKDKPRYRINPYTQPRETSAGDFIHYLDQVVDHYIEARKYTHNARAIFLHPVDPEKGFYSQLAQFANDMSMVDFDQIMALPDNALFRDAFAMYDKMVDETFASNDWRHFPSMFELKQNSLHTQVEEDVLEQLKVMYAPQLHSGEMSHARLEAALSMAVGASRGMFLNEIEKAAYADPHLDESGKATFASYYNQDNSALLALNPMHHHMRWQTANTLDPILFMPVEGFKGSKAFSDHQELWRKMQAYRDSFLKGREGAKLEGETLWSDFLVNIGKVGGPMTRKGWRLKYSLEPLFVRNTDAEKAAGGGLIVDWTKTWMRLENIGYDIMTEFPAQCGDIMSAYKGDKLEQKTKLFTHIYTKYFDGDGGNLQDYLKSIRKVAETSVLNRIKTGNEFYNPKDLQAEIEKETSSQFMNRALARMVADRIPSKILRMDRDRQSKQGISRWRSIAQRMGMNTAQFDDVMKDLLTAEQLLRKDVSTQMRQRLAEGREPWDQEGINYKLTEEAIDRLLRGKLLGKDGQPDEARMDQVKVLFRNIKETYMKPEFLDTEFANQVKPGEQKFGYALDEMDMSFIPWRGAGSRVLPRAIGDISTVEKNVSAEVRNLPMLLQKISLDGKHDFTPIIDSMAKVYNSLDGIIGTDYAHKVVHHMAALAINYFKKDTRARVAFGVFGLGQRNSLAAERAGRGLAVWEWDSRQIDAFCTQIESRAILPLKPYNPSNSKPDFVPVYINIPGIKRPIKLPESMKIFGKQIDLFQRRKPDYEWTSKQLRDQFGGNWRNKMFDILNTLLPMVLAWLIWKYMQEAMKESEGKKK